MIVTDEQYPEGRPVLAVLRGDHRVNEIKLTNAIGAATRKNLVRVDESSATVAR